MVLQISVRDDKAELFLQLVEELKSTMIDGLDIISKNGSTLSEDFFDEDELLKRVNEVKNNKVKLLTREEVFDGIC